MYAERPWQRPHVIAWRSVVPPGSPPVRILPDGCLDVIWRDGTVFVAGPDTTAQVVPSAPGSRLVALRFAAGTGAGVLGLPVDELTDRQVPLADLCGAAEARRVAEADDPFAALEAFTLCRWRPPDPAMVAVAAAARAGRPVGAIAAQGGISPRQLQRQCRQAFGYGAKTLTRIMRLQAAVALARAGRPFADVSVTTGYADQAHLSRDVKALAGVPLGELLPR